MGLAYSWMISPVEYTDASPSLLRTDFKDQYRAVIAASYASSHEFDRARARLAILGDADSIPALNAQAQQMLAAGEPFNRVQQVAQLASDLGRGNVAPPVTITPLAASMNTPTTTSKPNPTNQLTNQTPTIESTPVSTQLPETPFALTPSTPRPTHTSIPQPGAPFVLVGEDTVCNPDLQDGLLQVMLKDARRRQVPGIEIIVTWNGGEDRFFTGFKPEVGDGYADFVMQADAVYSIRIVTGSSTVPDISAPACTDANGTSYPGGLLLNFQQP
jgi:hypothetical protein